MDFVVAGKLIVELKFEDGMQPAGKARLLTYLYLTGTKAGLLINFNVPIFKDGIKEVKIDCTMKKEQGSRGLSFEFA